MCAVTLRNCNQGFWIGDLTVSLIIILISRLKIERFLFFVYITLTLCQLDDSVHAFLMSLSLFNHF